MQLPRKRKYNSPAINSFGNMNRLKISYTNYLGFSNLRGSKLELYGIGLDF